MFSDKRKELEEKFSKPIYYLNADNNVVVMLCFDKDRGILQIEHYNNEKQQILTELFDVSQGYSLYQYWKNRCIVMYDSLDFAVNVLNGVYDR